MWNSLLSPHEDLHSPSLEWPSEAGGMAWPVHHAPIDFNAPLACLNGAPSPAVGDREAGRGKDQREGGNPRWTANDQRWVNPSAALRVPKPPGCALGGTLSLQGVHDGPIGDKGGGPHGLLDAGQEGES